MAEMDDIYGAIIGAPPTDQEKLTALAGQLRKRQQIGQLGMITGDKVLSGIGHGIVGQTEDQAARIGGYQARARELAAQEAMRAAGAAERAAEAQKEREFRAGEGKTRREFEAGEGAKDRALRKALGEMKGTNPRYIPAKQFEDLTDQAQDTYNITGVISAFKPEYATAGVPGSREAANQAVSMGAPTTQNAKDAAAWWAQYEQLYTLPTRNKLFGSALTAPERAAWQQNAISPNMTADVIKQRLANLEKIKSTAMARKRQSFLSAGYDPEQIEAAFMDYSQGVPTDVSPQKAKKQPWEYNSYEEYLQDQGGGE